MRGVFATGVLDHFLRQKFNPFDFFLGVSAGASNIAAYLAEMPERNLKIYTDYALRPEFIHFKRFLKGGHLIDLDWLWRVTIAEIRLNLSAIHAHQKPFFVVMTNVKTGTACYQQTTPDSLEDLLLASSAMPLLYRGFPMIDQQPMTDGGIADALPIARAIDQGARKIMIVRSRPASYKKKKDWMSRPMAWKYRQYPKLKSVLLSRTERYNQSLALIRNPPKGVQVIEVCPPEDFKPSRLGKDQSELQRGYHQGSIAGQQAINRWLTLA